MKESRVDYAVIGGGIVGLSVARELQLRHQGASVSVLEKETDWAAHQSGRNSGVIHSGLYYVPGSLKARLCTAGARSMVDFCAEYGIAHEVAGKLVVATTPQEATRLDLLEDRGRANGVPVRRLSSAQIQEYEPNVAGVSGLHVASTGIADYGAVARTLARLVAQGGGDLRPCCRLTAVRRDAAGLRLETTTGDLRAGTLVNCAGLHSDRVAALSGVVPPARIVPFRGEYYALRPQAMHLVRGLVYPVPNPAFPFLGVHFTRGVDGSIHAGPNAVPALSREGYRWRDVDARDVADTLRYSGFRRLAMRHWDEGAREIWRSVSRRAFVAGLRRLVPVVGADDLVPSPAGVRAQAVLQTGALVDDFLIVRGPCSLHVLNAPSPAATSALEIAKVIASQVPAPPKGS